MQNQERSAKWDNLKFVLIFMVVLGHILFPFRNESNLVKGLYVFIYMFHMPLFIFVSGLFSKTIIRKKQWNRVFSYLALYIFIRALDTFGTLVHKKKLRLNFFRTNGPDWYAMAVFLFLVITIIFQKTRPLLLLSAALAVGLLAGYSDIPGNLFAFMRSCVFYPFFLLGYYADRSLLEKYSKPDISVGAGIILIALLLFFLVKGNDYYSFIGLLKAKKAYDEIGIMGHSGPLLRIAQYLGAMVTGLLLILSVPSKRTAFSVIGTKTLPIFVWHYLFLKIFWALSGKKLVMALFPETYMLILLCMCMLVILFCSSYFFDRTNRIMDFANT